MGTDMGRGVNVGSNAAEHFPESPDSGAIDLLLDRALRRDEEALRVLVTLLKNEHYGRFVTKLKYLSTSAHTGTIEDVIQDSIITLMGKIRSGALELDEKDRTDFLKYFQRFLDGRLRNAVRARKSPGFARNKAELPAELADPKIVRPVDPGHQEHRELLLEATERLDAEKSRLLGLYLDGVPFSEISRVTGKHPKVLSKDIARIKQELLLDILPNSETAQLHQEHRERQKQKWPTRPEIESAIGVLPPTLKEAVAFVHLEVRSSDDLARKLGENGAEKAQARLEQGYRSLAFKFKVPFPEAFRHALP
jgi:DNA-directed RNA polymerase specialized sigma24 family protein